MIRKSTFILLSLFALTTCLEIMNPFCELCHEIVKNYQQSIPRRPFQQFLDEIGTTYCSKKHLQNHKVCKGAVHEMMDSIVNSIWVHYTDPHSVCHKLRLCPREYFYRNLTKDIEKIMEGKIQKQWEKSTSRKTLKIMHISDLHLDLFYTVGAPAKCSEPVCCRSNVTSKLTVAQVLKQYEEGHVSEQSKVNDSPAGYWGSLYSCDLPFQTFDLFLKELKQHNVDMIYWTGDNTPHDIWQQSQSYNLNFTVIETERMKKFTSAKIVAAMGNHESFPVNVYDYDGQREQMLNSGLAQAWKPWLTPSAYEMLRTKGYYSMVIPEMNNLKIISMNTQAQNKENWYLLRNPTDPGGMLEWIERQLNQSQNNHQFVHILGHIPPKSALNEWAMRFNALTERYSYTIRGQFYGHTHTDHVCLFTSIKDNTTLVNYCLVAPSLTTQLNKHPEYRVIEVDFDTLQVVNYHQYKLDLNKYTKKEDSAKFQHFYSFKEAYGLTDMAVKGGMTTFMNQLKTNPQTQIAYTYFLRSGSEPGKPGNNIICDTMTSPSYSAACAGSKYKKSGFEIVAGRWKDLKHKQ